MTQWMYDRDKDEVILREYDGNVVTIPFFELSSITEKAREYHVKRNNERVVSKCQ